MIPRRMRRPRRSVERKHMHFDLAAIPQTDAYKLLVSTGDCCGWYARASDFF